MVGGQVHHQTCGPHLLHKPSTVCDFISRAGPPPYATDRHVHTFPVESREGIVIKNCRTSVEMIEKYYAAHIKTSLDAAAINVMRPKKNKKGKKAIQNTQASSQPPDEETDV
jgi:hypothetical protein